MVALKASPHTLLDGGVKVSAAQQDLCRGIHLLREVLKKACHCFSTGINIAL
jgi:hypothetical protein